MAQTNYTPISLYYSTTAAAVPTSGNLVAGELALNTVDEKLYFKNSAGTVKQIAGAGVGGIAYTAVQTSNYTAANNDGVLTNTTAAGFTVTLPTSPSVGNQIIVADSFGTWGTNNLTIDPTALIKIAGQTAGTTLTCNINSVAVTLVYTGATYGWDIFAQIGANDTSVLTQTNTVSGITNKTFVAPVLGTPASGNLQNCSLSVAPAIGNTTPSTGAFTTGTFNGAVTFTGAITNPLVISGQTTNYFQITGSNTGGQFRLGINNSAGNQLGGLVYSTVFGSISTTPIEIITDNSTRMTISSAGAIRFNTGYGSGAVTSDASGNLTITSDEAIKTEIEPFTRGLKEILGLSKSNATITYKYNEESGLETKHRYAGFSANIVETIIPEAVGESGKILNGKMLRSISDRPIIAALVNAIAEQQAQIDELRKKLI